MKRALTGMAGFLWVASLTCVILCQTEKTFARHSCCETSTQATCYTGPAASDGALVERSALPQRGVASLTAWLPVQLGTRHGWLHQSRFLQILEDHDVGFPGLNVLTDSPPQAPPIL